MGSKRDIKNKVPSTPCYVINTGILEDNLRILSRVQDETGCDIILALKGFSMFSLFPLIKQYLKGTSASSLDEARLGFEELGKEVHVCAPAYSKDNLEQLTKYASHIIFNSFSQWKRYRSIVERSGRSIKCGLRINPEHSEVKVKLYDPCAPCSRLGIRFDQFRGKDIEGIAGLHFHNLCELNADSLERTLVAVESKFGSILHKMEWINFGGGHHITRKDYNVEKLCALVKDFHERYNVKVYLEPGEAIALNTGFLVSSVLDIVNNEMDIAILDTSAAAHMPDVLEMPYRPGITEASELGRYNYNYRLGGLTCLAGDVIGDYSFPEELKIGDRVVFEDMAHYTMVKNNTFNGVRLPAIAIYDPEKDEVQVVKKFGYEDYRNRLS